MTVLALFLALLAGASLGLFGAGGSILLVPSLVYVLELPAREAIATSLLVLFVTSSVALLSTAARRQLNWKSALPLGIAAMAGGYGGGRAAEHVAAPHLLVGFALLAIAAAIAMLRTGRREPRASGAPAEKRPALTMALMAGVGFVVGLVGAGGGFLVVPALVVLANLPVRAAIATSILIVAMQSLAGLLGHAGTVELNWPLAVAISAFAVIGSAAGAQLAARLAAVRLRRGFAWFLAVVGATLLILQLPAAWLGQTAARLAPLAPVIGGIVIGLASALLWIVNGRVAGVSGIAGGALQWLRGDRGWRLLFLLGLLLGGIGMRWLMPGAFEAGAAGPGTLVIAGLLVGTGTTLANGCTSGHGICGISRFSRRSFAAVGAFMAAAMVTVYLARHVLGGES